MPKDKNGLTPKQARFVAEYLIDLNATQAAIRAGYSEKAARVVGCQNLTKPNISEAVRIAIEEKLTSLDLSFDRIVLEAARVGTSDARQLFGEGGQLLSVPEISEDTARAISSVKVTRNANDDEQTTEVRFWPKLGGLELVGKLKGMLGQGQVPTSNTIVRHEHVHILSTELLRQMQCELLAAEPKILPGEIIENANERLSLPRGGNNRDAVSDTD